MSGVGTFRPFCWIAFWSLFAARPKWLDGLQSEASDLELSLADSAELDRESLASFGRRRAKRIAIETASSQSPSIVNPAM
jgi:hypothetical protein